MWQQLWPKLAPHIHFVSVAVDAQGRSVVEPWIERAGATFVTIVDEDNALAEAVGFNAVPVALFFASEGKLVHGPISLDVRKDEVADAVLRWARDGEIGDPLVRSRMEVHSDPKAAHLFREGQLHLANGDREAALDAWRRARNRVPQNWLIRKQIWALENPDRFYDGPVDFGWQEEQLAREEAEGETT